MTIVGAWLQCFRAAPATGEQTAQTRGVFALMCEDQTISKALLNNPSVDGIALRTTWDKVETGANVYNWSYLDGASAAAGAAGKKVSFSIWAGIHTPSWVYDAGAKPFKYNKGRIPVPWNPVFQTKWRDFVRAVGSRYGNNAALTQVKITGINMDTSETMLPRGAADVTRWHNAGYTSTKVFDAWKASAAAFADAFPNKQIAYTLIPDGFVPIDAKGNPIDDRANWQLVIDIMKYGIATYGNRFAVQNDGLSTFWVSEMVSGVAKKTPTGYQMLWWVTNDSGYHLNKGASGTGATILQQAVDKGVAAGARYLEIYQEDILNPALSEVIVNAHNRLMNH